MWTKEHVYRHTQTHYPQSSCELNELRNSCELCRLQTFMKCTNSLALILFFVVIISSSCIIISTVISIIAIIIIIIINLAKDW